MNRLKLNIATIPQTKGQTACLIRQGVNCVFHNKNSILKSKLYSEELSPTWSSLVADPSHSPIERGQRHGPLRREKKVRIIKNINIIRIDRISKKIKMNTKKQLKGQKCVIQLKDTRNINQFQSRGVDG